MHFISSQALSAEMSLRSTAGAKARIEDSLSLPLHHPPSLKQPTYSRPIRGS